MPLNPHPPLSAFPLVILTLIVLLEIFLVFRNIEKVRSLSTLLLCFLAVISPLTYFSGYWGVDFANRSFEISQDLIEGHQMLAHLYLFFLVATLALAFAALKAEFSKKAFLVAYRIFLVLTYLIIVLTSAKGGELVFEHGAGVGARNPTSGLFPEPKEEHSSPAQLNSSGQE